MLQSTFHCHRQTGPNIIVFGGTGAGKSSVVNMLPGGCHEATVSSTAKGVTFQHECFKKDIRGHHINVFDTVGLGEGKSGTVSAPKAIEALYRLMRGLDGGVSLLVYVVRGPRLSPSIRKNYELFYEIFCQKKVTIVIVITGLENEEDMDDWWKKNETAYIEEKMTFAGAACITAIKGKRNMFAQEFEESQAKVEALVFDHCFKTTWLPPSGGWTSWLRTFYSFLEQIRPTLKHSAFRYRKIDL
jgi:predicted GTPase